MERPVAVQTHVPGGSVLIDVANIAKVDAQWAGGRFGTRVDFYNGNFVIVPQSQVALLQGAGLLAHT
jgi:hypothetical protein